MLKTLVQELQNRVKTLFADNPASLKVRDRSAQEWGVGLERLFSVQTVGQRGEDPESHGSKTSFSRSDLGRSRGTGGQTSSLSCLTAFTAPDHCP